MKPTKPKRRKARDAEGRERPRFLLRFPRDPELEELVRAFESGDYAMVRARAPVLARESTRARVRTAAGELLRRIEPDPLLKYIFLGLAVLLLYLAFWAYGHTPH